MVDVKKFNKEMEMDMDTKPQTRGEEYYKLVGQKSVEGIKRYLHDEVEFYGPLANLKGKEAVVEATHHFMNAIKSLTIRAKFGVGDQALIVYDVDMPGVAKDFPGASLLNFREGVIVRIQLFYDGDRVEEKKNEIFS
jgi:hypothetical protein